MSLVNNAIGNVGANPSNLTPKKRPASGQTSSFQATAGASSTNTVNSNLSYSATGQILIDKGQIVRGEVTDIRNNMVSIKVDLGETITYPLQGDPELSIGQSATFKAVETEDGIALRAISARPSQARLATINKALEEAGLQKSERNQTIVLELLNNQMSIDKQTIQKIFQQSLLNKNASISTLVLMTKHNMPITDEISTQFENYRNQEHRLSKEIGKIADEIPTLLDKISTFTTSKNFLAINDGLMDIFLKDSNATTETSLASVINSNTEISTLLDILKPFALTDSLTESILNHTASLRNVVTCIQDSITMAEQKELEAQSALLNSEESLDSANTALTDAFQNPTIRHILEQFTNQQFSNNELSTFLSLQNRQTLSIALSNFPLSQEIHDDIISGQIGTNKLLHVIKDSLQETNSLDAKTLYSTQSFQWVLKEHIRNTMSLTTNDIADNKVKDYYDTTYNQINDLNNFLQNTGLKEAFTGLSETSQNFQENLEFMKVLNQLFPYVQLPIKLKEQFVHSDLYVYTKKKNLREKPDNVSVLLHLDMEYLGPTDIHINLSRSNIQAKFYMSDEFSTNLLKNNIDLLEETLTRSGYLLQTEFIEREKEIDIVKDIIEKDQPTTSLKRYSFDIRA
ncbi:flagellar hook-length control protein FliK [Anaerosporobacter sp.]|uniref:flagellar hook-length control protein FliK n=1 Tax=Anaerosporobacter sp. TaxID=1872529 RepID=UPI00286EF894|nr:flagellar hook-length control protein FliK [Anaerosporobacter sp.]